MKKIVSQILTICMACGMFNVLPAKAEAEELYPDYIPAEEMPENLLGKFDLTAEREFCNTLSRNSTAVNMFKDEKYGWKWGNADCYTPQTMIAQQDITPADIGNIGLIGMMMQTWVHKSNLTREWIQFDNNKSYVVSLMIKNPEYNESNPTHMQMCLTNEVANSTSFSKEYGTEGYEVTKEYERYSDTIKPAEGFDPENTNILIVGFYNAKQGDAFSVRTEEKGDVYIGEEVAFDIKNELLTEPEDVCQGEEITVSAAVVNQGGKKGYLQQNFEWTALNGDKTAPVEGFIFNDKADGETSVTISSDVPVGRYALVASSIDYEGFNKTVFIDVLNERIKDSGFDSEKPETVIVNSSATSSVKITNSSAISTAYINNNTAVKVTAKTDISNDVFMGMDGVEIHPVFNGFKSGFNFEPKKTYAVSVWVRKSESSLADTDVYFNAAVGQKTEETLSYTNEYGEEGMKLTDSWQKFAATITVSENYDNENSSEKHLYLGMPNGTPKDCAFELRYDSDFYLAESKSVGMIIEKVPADTSSELTLDNSLKLRGGYANQIGVMTEDVQNLRWYVLNEARKETDETFKISVSEDGKMAEVSATEITKKGNYYIVVENEDEDGTVKRVSLAVTVNKPEMAESIIISLENNTAEILEDKLEMFAEGLNIEFFDVSAMDKAESAELIKTEISSADLADEAELKKFLEKIMFISILNAGTNTELLLNDKGEFVCEEALDLEKYDENGVTIYKLFKDDEYDYLSDEGMKNILDSMKENDFTSFSEFDEKVLEEIVLNIIAYPGLNGTDYVSEILTEENGERIGLDMTKYVSYKGAELRNKNKDIARNLFTKENLQKKLNEKKETNKGGGGGGGAPTMSGIDIAKPTVSPTPVVTKEEKPFTDVSEEHWAYSDIYHLKEIGVISGVGNDIFLPDGTVTREQFVKMFVEAMEYDITSTDKGFSDVNDGEWYAPYIATAVEKGLITGISSDKFGVGMPITRQDVCVIVSRAIDDIDGEAEPDFADVSEIDEYAKEAVSYLTSFGVIKGFEDNTFRPKTYCTRAQTAKIICTILNMKGLISL